MNDHVRHGSASSFAQRGRQPPRTGARQFEQAFSRRDKAELSRRKGHADTQPLCVMLGGSQGEGRGADEPPRQRHRRPPEPAPAAAPLAGNPRPHHRDRAAARKAPTSQAALAAIRSEFPTVTDFEREFPSLCFALATGVGKTRLMGAFISYLHLAHGINNFFVLAPNLTIYNKLIADFTPNTPKYVFKGIAEFATEPPEIITGDNYERPASARCSTSLLRCNDQHLQHLQDQLRGARRASRRASSACREYIGESYFDYLAGLDDLVLLMDESHRYRASAGIRAINELKPVLGLELTATPVRRNQPRARSPFKNVIYRLSAWPRRWRTASSRSRPSSRARTSTRPACRPRRSSG